MSFDSGREHIHLAGVCVAVGDCLGFNDSSSAAQLHIDGTLYIESIVGAQYPRCADDLERSPVFGADRNYDRTQGSARKFQGQDGGGFYSSRIGV